MAIDARDLALYFAFMVAAMSILSFPLAPATLIAAKTSAPWAVALAAAVAAGIAAVFDHMFVRRAFRVRALDRLRQQKLFKKAEGWVKVAPFLTTGVFAGVPLPFTIVRVLVPLSGYPVKSYATAVALGRFPRIFVIAAFGTVVDIPTPVLLGLLAAGVAVGGITAVVRGRGYLRTPEPEDEGDERGENGENGENATSGDSRAP
jgi:uncharacterized membrane protein YdjX (TVP38/TMEM64 family)